MNIQLRLLTSYFAIVRLHPTDDIPPWSLAQKHLLSIIYTEDELSIVCDQHLVPDGVLCERDWRALKIVGPLDFSLVGILAPIATLLAQQAIPIFALSTYDTDYILLKDNMLARAQKTLEQVGYDLL